MEVNIINFKNEYEKHFYDLNIEWLNNFFEVEEYDHKILSNAKKYIIDKGGKIFFAVLGDKIIAGTTTAAGGALGGIGAVSALGKFKNNPALRMMGEFGGGAVGDMGGQIVGDALMRAKGGGSTPFEKIQADADQQYRREIEERILAQIGMGGYNQTNLIGMG